MLLLLLLLVGRPEFNLRRTDLKRTQRRSGWKKNGSPGTGNEGCWWNLLRPPNSGEISRGEHTFSLPRRDSARKQEENNPNPRPKHGTAAEIRNEPMEPTLGERIRLRSK